ncbi:hypothetical protein OIO90_005492 [Microbotryomycetes sp. JL221]|nr:hypothetical protein OIO90_005492 [Microbotryomycetes sp. JL221]
MFARTAARTAARAAGRRAYASSAGAQHAAKPKSDFVWAVGSLAVFGPMIFYLTSPPQQAHAHHTQHAKPVAAHKPEQTKDTTNKPGPEVSESEEEETSSDDEPAAAAAETADAPADDKDESSSENDKADEDNSSAPVEDVKEDSQVMKTKQIGKPKNVAEAAAASVRTHRAEKEQKEQEKANNDKDE